jgi:hypothetical protein
MTRCTWAAGPAPVPLGTASTSTVAFAPQCTPTVAPCVTVEFAGLTASVEGHDFLTFTLTDTVQGSSFGITLIVFACNYQQSASTYVSAFPAGVRL